MADDFILFYFFLKHFDCWGDKVAQLIFDFDSLRGKLSVTVSGAQPLCGPQKVFYETAIWKRRSTNSSFYRKTSQISSLPLRHVADKAHNASCRFTKLLPEPVRRTVTSFLSYCSQIHNTASWLCQS